MYKIIKEICEIYESICYKIVVPSLNNYSIINQNNRSKMLSNLKIVPKIYVAFDGKDTDKIVIEAFNTQSLERKAHYVKHGIGSLLIENNVQSFLIDGEDIFCLLSCKLIKSYPNLCLGHSVTQELQKRRGYSIRLDPTYETGYIVLEEICLLENEEQVIQSILCRAEVFLVLLYEVAHNFCYYHYKIQAKSVSIALVQRFKEIKNVLNIFLNRSRLAEANIKAIESLLEEKLPAFFIDFLAKNAGKYPNESGLSENFKNKWFVDYFNEFNEIYDITADMLHRYNKKIVAFAFSTNRKIFCFSIDKLDYGNIFIHLNFNEEFDVAYLKIANSLVEFIEELKKN
jgi:hypothetical protein